MASEIPQLLSAAKEAFLKLLNTLPTDDGLEFCGTGIIPADLRNGAELRTRIRRSQAMPDRDPQKRAAITQDSADARYDCHCRAHPCGLRRIIAYPPPVERIPVRHYPDR